MIIVFSTMFDSHYCFHRSVSASISDHLNCFTPVLIIPISIKCVAFDMKVILILFQCRRKLLYTIVRKSQNEVPFQNLHPVAYDCLYFVHCESEKVFSPTSLDPAPSTFLT